MVSLAEFETPKIFLRLPAAPTSGPLHHKKIAKSKVKNFAVIISMSVKNVIAIMVSLSESETPKIFLQLPVGRTIRRILLTF